ncbi:MAG: accessory gene regulator B family protein [Lachnospiraceae bacterium]|nr:accessory gene regulator B family protein [Lachnospiraceae bacterium]
MIETMAMYTVTRIKDHGIIEKEEEELYFFGIKQLILFLVNLATTMVIGIMVGMLWQSIVFSAAYIPLRRYAGGYHATTPKRCYWLSSILILCALIIVKCLPLSKATILGTLAVAALVIIFRAPVESRNKPLSTTEQILYQKKSRIILGLETVLVIYFSLNFIEVAACIAIAIGCSAFVLIVPEKRDGTRTCIMR